MATTQSDGPNTTAATTSDAAEESAAPGPHRRRLPMALVTGAFVILVLLIVVVLLVLKVTRGTTTVTPPPVAPAPAAVVRQATSIPAATYDAVGAPQAPATGTAVLSGQPALVSGTRPLVVFVGAEFCPYCAAERWVLVTALSRFGTFSHLGATSSSSDVIFPGTPTFSFDGTTYKSRHVDFSSVEEFADSPSNNAPGGFPLLHQPSPLQWGLIHRYDAMPYVPGNGTLPFVDVANRMVVSGPGMGFSPGVFQGRTMAQVAADLSDPTRSDTQAVLGAANVLSAAICAADGGAPTPVCESPGVQAGGRQLGLPVKP
jgi:hypothetical protein